MPVPAVEEEDESHRTDSGSTTHHVDSNEIGPPHEDRRTAEDHFKVPAAAFPNYDLHDVECQSLSPSEAISPKPEKPAAGEAANEIHDLVPIYRAASFCLPPGSCTTPGAESEDSSLEETATATQSQLTSGESDTSSATVEGFDCGHFETTPDSQPDDSCIAESTDEVKCLQASGEVSFSDEPSFEETTTTTQSTGESDASSAAIEDFSHVGATPDSQADDSSFDDSADDVKCLQGETEAPPSHQVGDEMPAFSTLAHRVQQVVAKIPTEGSTLAFTNVDRKDDHLLGVRNTFVDLSDEPPLQQWYKDIRGIRSCPASEHGDDDRNACGGADADEDEAWQTPEPSPRFCNEEEKPQPAASACNAAKPGEPRTPLKSGASPYRPIPTARPSCSTTYYAMPPPVNTTGRFFAAEYHRRVQASGRLHSFQDQPTFLAEKATRPCQAELAFSATSVIPVRGSADCAIRKPSMQKRASHVVEVNRQDLLSFDHSPAFADLGMKAREYAKEVHASHVVDMEPADTLAFPECRHVSLMAMLPAYAMKERRLPPPKGVKSGSEVSYNRGGWNPTRSEKFLTSARSARNTDGGTWICLVS
ncbi:CACNA1G [Symbiodinium sp. CCMP2456]|nr:CACNA1G [Symbiodinium sp. CCMP2456]